MQDNLHSMPYFYASTSFSKGWRREPKHVTIMKLTPRKGDTKNVGYKMTFSFTKLSEKLKKTSGF